MSIIMKSIIRVSTKAGSGQEYQKVWKDAPEVLPSNAAMFQTRDRLLRTEICTNLNFLERHLNSKGLQL